MKPIYFFDTTLRDGIQASGNFISLEKRIEIVKIIEDIGIDVIEIGYPAASSYEENAVKKLSEITKKAKICVFSRCNKKDIEVADACCQNSNSEIELLVSGSDILLKYKRQQSRDENITEMLRSIQHARNLFPSVSVVIEDSGRADLQYLNRLIKNALDAGISKIVFADTVGYCLPEEYGNIIRNSRKIAQNVRISAHCHNDLGLAVANSLTALENGADEIQTTFLGIGERAGNTAFHTLLMVLTARTERYKYTHNINIARIYLASCEISRLLNRQIPKEEPVIGENAFLTEAGMHQAGLLSHPSTYSIIDPSLFNRQQRISIGPLSGRRAIDKKCYELGLSVSPEQLDKLTNIIKSYNHSINDAELSVLIKEKLKCAQ